MELHKNTSRRKKLWIIFLIILVLAVGAVGYRVFFSSTEKTASVVAGDFLPDGKDASKMTDKQLGEFAQQAVDKSQFNMRIVSKATLNKNTGKANIAIQNPPVNTYPVNVVITDNQTGAELYSSGAIYPGEEIKEATIDKKLADGVHQSTATFNIYNEKTKKQQGSVQSELILVVE